MWQEDSLVAWLTSASQFREKHTSLKGLPSELAPGTDGRLTANTEGQSLSTRLTLVCASSNVIKSSCCLGDLLYWNSHYPLLPFNDSLLLFCELIVFWHHHWTCVYVQMMELWLWLSMKSLETFFAYGSATYMVDNFTVVALCPPTHNIMALPDGFTMERVVVMTTTQQAVRSICFACKELYLLSDSLPEVS